MILALIVSILSSMLNKRIIEETNNSKSHIVLAAGFITHVSIYLSSLPLIIPLVLNIFYIISSRILVKEYTDFKDSDYYKHQTCLDTVKTSLPKIGNIRSGEKRSNFEVFNPTVIPDLGDVDEVFFDKTGTLSTNSYDVKSIATKHKFYRTIKPNFISQKLSAERDRLL